MKPSTEGMPITAPLVSAAPIAGRSTRSAWSFSSRTSSFARTSARAAIPEGK